MTENCVESENLTLIQRQCMLRMNQACLDTISLHYFTGFQQQFRSIQQLKFSRTYA